ncbi:hypothetical protein [Rhodovarius sp.]|uniref:hypothetical protein n=1 Tax=Rhodovarius sp. TaxID=2972673 RepID=UPI0033412C70
MDKSYSIAELRLLFPDAAGQIRLDMTLATSHKERLAAVERAIDHVVQDLSRTRQLRQHKNEDLLTADIILCLGKMGFQATHDTAYGGHVDVVIEGRDDFLWLGEAKVHGDYNWLMKGFQQLATRYSTGLQGQDAGGMLIYCYNQRADLLMKEWKERLSEARPDVAFDASDKSPIEFHSYHAHVNTGISFKVRHLSVSLYFKPQDTDR